MGKGKGEGRYIFRRLESRGQSDMRHRLESVYSEEWDSLGASGGCMENRNECSTLYKRRGLLKWECG